MGKLSLLSNNVGSTIYANIYLARPFSLRAIKNSLKNNVNCNFDITFSNGHTLPLCRRLDGDGKALKADIELRDGIECYIAEKNGDAIKHFEAAAAYGSVDAFNLVGVGYLSAIGGMEDGAKAVKWFEKAAKHGNLPAMANLAYCYETGKGVKKKDIYKAESYYLKIALQGDLGGVFGLAALYYRQSIYDSDIRQVAIALFGLADEYGYKKAEGALSYIDNIYDLAYEDDPYDEDDGYDYYSRTPGSPAFAAAAREAKTTGKSVTLSWDDAMEYDKKMELEYIPEYSTVDGIDETKRKEIINAVRRIISRKR